MFLIDCIKLDTTLKDVQRAFLLMEDCGGCRFPHHARAYARLHLATTLGWNGVYLVRIRLKLCLIHTIGVFLSAYVAGRASHETTRLCLQAHLACSGFTPPLFLSPSSSTLLILLCSLVLYVCIHT